MTPDASSKGDAVRTAPAARRRPLFLGLAAAGLLLAGAAGYIWLRGPAVVPPVLRLDGADPQAVTALEAARADVVRQPRSAPAWGHLGMLLFAHDYYAEAQACLTQAERLDPENPRWPYFQGLILYLSEPAAGIACFQRAVERQDTDFNLRLRLAEALLAQDRAAEAESEFHCVLELHPGNQRAHLGLGQLAFRQGDAQASVPHLQAALTSTVSERAARALLAEAYHRLGDAPAAAREQQLAAELTEDVAWPDPYLDEAQRLRQGTRARLDRATRLLNQGLAPQALAALHEVLQQAPDSGDAYHELGRAYLRLGEVAAAVPVLRQGLQLRPDSVETYFLLGIALHGLKDYPAAAAAFRKATDLKPAYAVAHFNLGQCLAELGDKAGAVAACRTALRYRPNLVPAHVKLAGLLAQGGEDAEAVAHLKQALQLAPDNAEAKKLREEIQARTTRPAKP